MSHILQVQDEPSAPKSVGHPTLHDVFIHGNISHLLQVQEGHRRVKTDVVHLELKHSNPQVYRTLTIHTAQVHTFKTACSSPSPVESDIYYLLLKWVEEPFGYIWAVLLCFAVSPKHLLGNPSVGNQLNLGLQVSDEVLLVLRPAEDKDERVGRLHNGDVLASATSAPPSGTGMVSDHY